MVKGQRLELIARDEGYSSLKDLTVQYNYNVKSARPTIINTRLNNGERNVNRVAPNNSNAILRTTEQAPNVVELMQLNSFHFQRCCSYNAL